MNDEKLIKEFTCLVKEYCHWVENDDKQDQGKLHDLQVLLSKLYCWGIQLPDCEVTDLSRVKI